MFSFFFNVIMVFMMKFALDSERRALMLVSYDRFKEKKEYQTILENIDSGIITTKNDGISFFNQLGKEFMIEAANQSE
jgi:hypothetical protein